MLVPRKLDDQSFEQILQEAEGRLPWLCPAWTDHNAHDPGITLLELMAWYKEMQQYHMDQTTPALQKKMLKLLGVTPAAGQPATLAIQVGEEEKGWPALSRLVTPQEVVCELLEPIPAQRARLEQVNILAEDGTHDVSGLLTGGMTVQPFAFGGQRGTALRLGFRRLPEQGLRLWFQVAPPEGVARNPFGPWSQAPRTIRWVAEGLGPVEPAEDQTWALSQSGFVELPVLPEWQAGGQGLWWLRLELEEGGCEEQVRLSGLAANRYRAAQQQTWAASHWFTVEPAAGQQVLLEDALAQVAQVAVFLRQAKGWQQILPQGESYGPAGRWLQVDAAGARAEGPNLLVVCLDPIRSQDLLLDAKGRPGETLHLNLQGQRALAQHLSLWCDTLEEDGEIRPAAWRCVDDLYQYGPRDRVFTYDPIRETIAFGDGLHGAIPQGGQGAVLVAGLVLSLGSQGNLPAQAGLYFADDGTGVQNGAATGGQDPETPRQAGARLRRMISQTEKCVAAGDYERRAKATPGLRVAAAKALPGYDPARPGRQPAVVTVVVIPASEEALPRPDERFLSAVARQLEEGRPLCIRTQVTGPCYVEYSLSLRLLAGREVTEEQVRRWLWQQAGPLQAGIGRPLRKDDLAAVLQKLPGLWQVQQIDLGSLHPRCYRTAAGDLELPPDGVPWLGRLQIEWERM